MNFSQRTRGIVRVVAVAMALALPVMMTVSAADARVVAPQREITLSANGPVVVEGDDTVRRDRG